jgi:hypothetical protein
MNRRPSSTPRHRRADTHERVEDHVAGLAGELEQPAQHPERLLGRMDRVLDPLIAAADRRLDEVVHVALAGEVPGVTLVPAADDELAAVEEADAAELGRRVRLVPDDELEGVERRVEDCASRRACCSS